MGRVLRSHEARIDLLQIGFYIGEHNPVAAIKFLERLEERFDVLAQNPLSGEACPEFATELRRSSVGNYVIFFRPLADGIELVRVIHGARDINDLF